MRILLRFKNIILCLGLLSLLSACDGDDTWCLGSDEDTYSDESVITNQSSLASIVNADGSDPNNPGTLGRWVYSGSYVTKGDKIDIIAEGDIITAMPYGLTEGSNPSSEYSTGTTDYSDNGGSTSTSEYQNDGKGVEFIINANSSSPTLITTSDGKAFNLTYGQYVTVTTATCASYASSTAKPTKWTWSSGWEYQAVRCKYKGGNNFSSSEPKCKAVNACGSQPFGAGWWYDSYPGWECNHDTLSTSNVYVTDPSKDTCPSDNAQGPTYICENNISASGSCYTPTTPAYQRGNGDWCDGSHKASSGVTVSNTSPGCDQASSNNDSVNRTTPEYNPCGTTDTCWNTGGYRLYAVQTGVQCPNDEQCIHLNQSTSGKSFSSVGGSLYLQIIDPNNTGSTADISSQQAQIASNNQQIASDQAQIETLETTLRTQLNTVNDYSPEMKTLENQAVTLGAGLNAYNQTPKDQLAELQLLFNNQTEGVDDIEEAFSRYSAQISSTTQAEGDTPNPWQATLTTMSSQANGIIVSAQGLTTTIYPAGSIQSFQPIPYDPSATTTTQQMVDYQSSVVKTLSDLNVAIVAAQSTQTSIDTLNQQIADLEAQNEQLEQEILAANNVTYAGLTGGYTTYVKVDPLKASNGKYLKAIISTKDPNLAGTEYYLISENITNQSNPYDIEISGNVWLKIFDPDDNYSNNMDSYTVTISKLTTSGTFGAMFTKLIQQIKSGISAAAEKIFNGIACTGTSKTGACHEFITSINAMLVLYMAVFGMMFLFGLIQTDHVDFVMRAVKIAVVIILIRPDSFDFFSTYLFQGFMGFSDTLIANATGAPYSNPFDFLNQSISVMLFDSNTYFKIIALMFQGILGLVVFILLIYASVAFTMAIFDSFMIYMMSFIGLAMCFAVAPVFISFLLFKQTEHLFESWFKTMVRFVVQPVVLFIGLIVLNGMLTSLLEEMFNFKVCFKCTIPYNFVIPGFPEVGTATMFCVPWFSPWGGDNLGTGASAGTIITIPLAITYCMVTTVMRSYAKGISKEITQSIIGGMTMFGGGGQGRPLGPNPFGNLYSSAKGLVGMGKTDVARRKKVRMNEKNLKEKQGKNSGNGDTPKNTPGNNSNTTRPTISPPTTK